MGIGSGTAARRWGRAPRRRGGRRGAVGVRSVVKRLQAVTFLTTQALDRFLARTIARLRWTTIAALLLISLVQPAAGRFRVPEWGLVVAFAIYTLLLDGARRRFSGRRPLGLAAMLDVPAVGLVYLGCAQPGGPLFTLLVLAAVQTTAFMTLPGTLVYTGALAAITVLVEPMLPLWTGSLVDMRALSARLVVLAVVGVGMGTLMRRLEREQSAGRSMLAEAERLTDADEVRGAFVASVSHDLRTPLTAARAALVLLEASAGAGLRGDERDLLANGLRNVERLDRLIADLLTHNQLEAGLLRLDRAPLDVRVVVTEAMAAVHPLVRSRGQVVELDLPEPLAVEGDAGRLEQVFLNLLHNAHRHTPTGTRILVSGRAAADGVIVTVADDGPGVPPAELEAIFRRFHRLGNGGSGLGLAIARAIVEMHGGRVSAANGRDGGTLFRVTLPRSAPGGQP